MIVTKALEILERGDEIALLGKVVYVNFKPVMELKSSADVEKLDKLFSRNKNINYINNWIDAMKVSIGKRLEWLNIENPTRPYEDRGWTYSQRGDKIIVDVFLDNYDIEQFMVFEIPKDEIDLNELKYYAEEE